LKSVSLFGFVKVITPVTEVVGVNEYQYTPPGTYLQSISKCITDFDHIKVR
jgi:hypothetical protein